MSTKFLLNSSIYKEKYIVIRRFDTRKKKSWRIDDGMIVPLFVYNFASSDTQKEKKKKKKHLLHEVYKLMGNYSQKK